MSYRFGLSSIFLKDNFMMPKYSEIRVNREKVIIILLNNHHVYFSFLDSIIKLLIKKNTTKIERDIYVTFLP